MKEIEMYMSHKTPEWKFQTLKRAKVTKTVIETYFKGKDKTSLRDLTPEDIQSFYSDIQVQYSDSYCESLRLLLKNSFEYGISTGSLLLNPITSVSIPSKRVRAADEMRKRARCLIELKSKLSSEQTVILRLFSDYKLGYTEITELVVSDINIHTKQLRLRRKKKFVACDDYILKHFKKVLSERSLKIPAHDVVFMNDAKQPLTFYELMKMIVEWCYEAGV